MLAQALQWSFTIGMAIGPVMGFLHQAFIIKKSKSVGSFSIDICGILLFSNWLRINFYLFKSYDTALLAQSIFMIVAQLYLLHLGVKFGNRKRECHPKWQWQYFWRWSAMTPFWIAIGAFMMLTVLITAIFLAIHASFVGELIGFIALTSESMLMMPQMLQNCRLETVQGLSGILIFNNLVGDIAKLAFFILKNQPIQFTVCSIIQLTVDAIIVGQCYFYRNKSFNEEMETPRIEEIDHKNVVVEKDPKTTDNFNIEMENRSDQNDQQEPDKDENGPKEWQIGNLDFITPFSPTDA